MVAAGIDFLLNFAGGSTASPIDDGQDVLFGDVGHDWLVGGTNHDRLWGGYGDDLLQGDDNLDSTAGTADPLANNIPDTRATAPLFADIGYGGAGRDVLIANTAVDRFLDWSGEFNSYLVPFAAVRRADDHPDFCRRTRSSGSTTSLAPTAPTARGPATRPGTASRSARSASCPRGRRLGRPARRPRRPAARPHRHRSGTSVSVGNVGVRTPGPAPRPSRSLSRSWRPRSTPTASS